MTTIIQADGVSKRFRQHKRFPGFVGALRSLVTREYTEVVAVVDGTVVEVVVEGQPKLQPYRSSLDS